MKKLLASAFCSLLALGLATSQASAGNKCCEICLRPPNAFSPVCIPTCCGDGAFGCGHGHGGKHGGWKGFFKTKDNDADYPTHKHNTFDGFRFFKGKGDCGGTKHGLFDGSRFFKGKKGDACDDGSCAAIYPTDGGYVDGYAQFAHPQAAYPQYAHPQMVYPQYPYPMTYPGYATVGQPIPQSGPNANAFGNQQSALRPPMMQAAGYYPYYGQPMMQPTYPVNAPGYGVPQAPPAPHYWNAGQR